MPSREVKLAVRAPFRFEAIAGFLTARNQMPDVPVTFDGDLHMAVPSDRENELVARARRTFDLDADPVAIDTHLKKDKLLRPLLRKRPGPRVPGAWNPLDVAIRAIVGQQISVQAATTIMARGVTSGMPQSRIETIKRFREAHENDPSLLTRVSIERLTAIKGIGPWTANYIAMRLGDSDAFPHSDLGLRKAATAIGIENLLLHAERWRPFRAYAAIALWESL
jgi:3-methyladenine DNA glycosylase/8-oxoguanine DNA glycosylase